MVVIYLRSLLRDVKKINNKKLILKIESVINKIKKAKRLDDLHSIKKLNGHPSAYRIRIGDYRLCFFYEDNKILLARILKRSDIYKVFP